MLKVCKLLLTTVGHAQVQVVADACQSDSTSPPITASVHNHAVVLQQALHHIPNPNAECMTRNVALRLGQNLGEQVSGLQSFANTNIGKHKVGLCINCIEKNSSKDCLIQNCTCGLLEDT